MEKLSTFNIWPPRIVSTELVTHTRPELSFGLNLTLRIGIEMLGNSSTHFRAQCQFGTSLEGLNRRGCRIQVRKSGRPQAWIQRLKHRICQQTRSPWLSFTEKKIGDQRTLWNCHIVCEVLSPQGKIAIAPGEKVAVRFHPRMNHWAYPVGNKDLGQISDSSVISRVAFPLLSGALSVQACAFFQPDA